MASYAYYKLPDAAHYTKVVQTAGEPQRLYDYTDLSGKRGFVFAPFAVSEECPIVLIEGEMSIESLPPSLSVEEERERVSGLSADTRTPSSDYSRDFRIFHDQLLNGDFQKIVLSRSMEVKTEETLSPDDLFLKACRMYPHQFVCLVSTPASGTWLMATPEVLLEGNGHDWHTVALAGTMRENTFQISSEEDGSAILQGWSDKNIREQRLVATYVNGTLRQFCDDIREDGPRTIHAGGLVHLRSDFKFSLPASEDVGRLIAALHPTPAVCGLPKSEARSFILANEYCSRRYYSGFAGQLNPDGETHLYVSLRCMELLADRCRLYAGGGLLEESVEQKEWEETEAKMETMRKVFLRL